MGQIDLRSLNRSGRLLAKCFRACLAMAAQAVTTDAIHLCEARRGTAIEREVDVRQVMLELLNPRPIRLEIWTTKRLQNAASCNLREKTRFRLH